MLEEFFAFSSIVNLLNVETSWYTVFTETLFQIIEIRTRGFCVIVYNRNLNCREPVRWLKCQYLDLVTMTSSRKTKQSL